MTQQEKIAQQRYEAGEQYSTSTFIDEDTIIAGYGQLYLDFEFPLPTSTIIEIYGTQSWKQYFTNKGVFQYLITNLTTKETSISPYWNKDELNHHKELNPKFSFVKL